MLTLIVVIVAIAVVAYFSLPAFGAWLSKEEEVVKNVLDVNKDGKINAADIQAAAESAATQVAKKVKNVEAKVTDKVKTVAKKKMSAPKN